MGVPLVDDVLVDVSRSSCLFDEAAAATAAPLPGATGVGDEVAATQDVREKLLVDLGARLDQVAHRLGERTPAVGALHRADPAGADFAAVVEERLAGAGIRVPPHLARAAELVALRA